MSESPQIALGSYIAQAEAGGIAIVSVYEHVRPLPADPAAMATAEQLLEGLPVDRIPDVAGSLPLGSRMPLGRNPIFVGREVELRTLGAVLRGGGKAAVTGMRGVGKTQLASEFVHRYGQYFAGGVFWLSFADGRAIVGEVAACGGVGHLDLRPDFAGLPVEDQVRAVLAAWAGLLPRLLVFDNCEDPALLDRWGPRTGGCRVLVTSWRETWPATLALQSVPLRVLSRDQSVTLLRQHLRDPAADANELAAIAAELGDLPLALHLAGSVLAQHPETITPAAYLGLLRQPGVLRGPWLESDDPSPTGHVQQVWATFELSYHRLDATAPADALAIALSARAAHLAPGEPIPRKLLLATAELTDNGLEAILQAEKALSRLVALGLLERGAADTLRLHRLVAEYVRGRAADMSAQAAVERGVLATAIQRGGDPLLSPLIALQPHLRYVTDTASVRGDEQAARLCMALGDHLKRLGDYLGAKESYQRALAIRQERLGDQNPDTVAAINSVGLAHKDLGEYDKAQPYFERALAINPDTVASLNNLAFLLKDLGKYEAAQRHFERALAITRALAAGPGDQPEHRRQPQQPRLPAAAQRYVVLADDLDRVLDTAECFNNLGLVHKDRGDYPMAQGYFEGALKISQTMHGEHHFSTVPSLNNLAFLLKDLGNYAEAQRYFEQALMINETVWGEQHPDTINNLNNLGFLLLDRALAAEAASPHRQGRTGDLFAEARRHLEHALTIIEGMYPERHPRRAEGFDSLGQLLARQGEYVEARLYFERALAIRQQVLGEWHPETARSLSNLGWVLAAQGDDGYWPRQPDFLAQARSYLEQAVAGFERSPGPTHGSADAARAHSMLEDVETRLKNRNERIFELHRMNSG